MRIARDTATVFSRELLPAVRNPIGLLISMAQPVLFLVFFGTLLDASTGASSWQWFVPGILVMMGLSGPMSAGHSVLVELGDGVLERMLVSPLNRAAMLVGRALKESAVLVAQTVILVVLAIPLGFSPDPRAIPLALVLLVLFGVGLSGFSSALAIAAHPTGTLFWIVTQTLTFPLLLLSGALLPVQDTPLWLRTIAAVNPVAYVVDAQRALFTGALDSAPVLYGVLAALGIAVAGVATGVRAMHRGV